MIGVKRIQEFEGGDIVKVIECAKLKGWRKWKEVVDKTFVLTKEEAESLNSGGIAHFEDNEYEINFVKEMLVKIGKEEKEMSEYKELKGRIEALDEGWTKEADEIVEELYRLTNLRLWLDNYGPLGSIVIVTHGSTLDTIARDKGIGGTQFKAHFSFSDRCEKLEAFKKALLWLLENSSLKEKDIVGTKQKIEFEGKTYKAKILSEE